MRWTTSINVMAAVTALLLILVACAPAPTPTPDIDEIVAATVAARELAFFQTRLLSPEDGAVFDNPAQVTLNWEWARIPREGEAFDVRVWREGQPEYGIAWAGEPTYDLANWLTQQEPGEFLWTVAVIEGQDGTVDAVIGEPPPARHFTVGSNILPPPTPTPTPTPALIEDILVLQAADFEAQYYAHLPDLSIAITAIDFTPEGDMLALAQAGQLVRLRDTDGDGVADERQQLLYDDETSPVDLFWATGMALYEDRIYISDSERIGYLEDTDSDGIPDKYTEIINGLPSRIYPLHSNNGIVFGPDGKLYVAIGATSDHGPLQLEYEASILRMNPDGSDVEVFATGFRNSYDIAFAPDGRLFAGDNAPDLLDNEMPFYPPEELNYVREGRDYGFPDVYGKGIAIRPHDRAVEDPITELTTSSVTAGLTYYSARQFPPYYRDGLFVAQFGGFNVQGKSVAFVPLEPTADGGYTGEWEIFMTFINHHKPLDVIVGPDGALYISDWHSGDIIRVTYVGTEQD